MKNLFIIMIVLFLSFPALAAEKIILTTQTRCPAGYNKTNIAKVCCPTGSNITFKDDACCPTGYQYLSDGKCHKCPTGMHIVWYNLCCPNKLMLGWDELKQQDVCGN